MTSASGSRAGGRGTAVAVSPSSRGSAGGGTRATADPAPIHVGEGGGDPGFVLAVPPTGNSFAAYIFFAFFGRPGALAFMPTALLPTVSSPPGGSKAEISAPSPRLSDTCSSPPSPSDSATCKQSSGGTLGAAYKKLADSSGVMADLVWRYVVIGAILTALAALGLLVFRRGHFRAV